ncbi:MAG: glycogen synthase [Chloroflexota bacterium]|nr:glycogen synthase [Chloroflexota bacterium]
MHIVFAAAEVAPFAKVGGLADVAGSLPQALAQLGHDVTVYLPFHRSIDAARYGIPAEGTERSIKYGEVRARVQYPAIVNDGVRTVFVRNDQRLGRDKVYGYADDAKRYGLFCRAVAEDVVESAPDVVHAHDWHAGLLVPLVRGPFGRKLRSTATVFTIHNLAYQGRTANTVLDLVGLPRRGLAVEGSDECNPMARAIATSDVVSTVSQRYAQEILTPEFGEGLEGLLAERTVDLFGIVNGIDTTFFDPENDPQIPARYSRDDQDGKAACKNALQRESGLSVEPAVPVCAVIGRLVEQKGIDLLTSAAPKLLGDGSQLVVLGTGDPAYEALWRELAERNRGRLALTLKFDGALAQRIYAGSDLFLMPSRFEPCGLGQLISLRYGTIPVVRAVGGLADTVRDADEDPRAGNGFVFSDYALEAFEGALDRAIHRFRAGDGWHELRARAMSEDHSWRVSAQSYVKLYETARSRRRE